MSGDFRIYNFEDRDSWPKNEIGIYGLYNIDDGKIIVGQTRNKYGFYGRWSNYYDKLKAGKYENPYLQNSFSKNYNGKNFKFIILEICDRNILNQREIYWSKYFNSLDRKNGWNIKEPGINGKHSQETRDKLKTFRKKLGLWKGSKNPMFGSQRTGNKNPFYNKKHDLITRKRLSELAKNRKGNGPMLGKHHTVETRKKLSELRIGSKQSKESIQKMLNTRKSRGIDELLSKKKSISVIQLDINGEIIKIWDSGKKASQSLNIDASSISRCCKHKQKVSGGFQWRFASCT